MKPKPTHFQAKTQANARTARLPWLWLGFLVELLLLIIGRLFHLAPKPTAHRTAPARKPLRVFAFWRMSCLIFVALVFTSTIQANSFQLWASSMTLRSPAGADELKTITHPNGTETNRTSARARSRCRSGFTPLIPMAIG